jgi:hypothetical protein
MAYRVRACVTEWNGRHIHCFDLSGITDMDEARDAMRQQREAVAGAAPGSLLTLTDVSGSTLDRTALRALMELVLHNKPLVRAAAVVGLSEAQRRGLLDIERVSSREFTTFTSIEMARDWLVAQA